MKETIGVGTSHSKIILMGEHSVVYGYPALAIPLHEIQVTCRIELAREIISLKKDNPIDMGIYAALEHLGIKEARMTYEIDSQVPQKRGMGSSAAVAIAAVRAVFDYYEKELDQDLLEVLVNRAEMIAHKNPSGLDAKTCLSDKPIKFIRNLGFTELDHVLSAYLVIADTGIHGHTSQAVEQVARLGKKALPLLYQLGEWTEQFEEDFQANRLSNLGYDMNQAHTLLQDLGVSAKEADDLVAAALEAGALGAKMSGGGLGGCIIALVETSSQAEKIARFLEEKGAIQTWIQKL